MRCETQINPKTNRCVLKNGKVGSRIIGRPKLCDTVLNKDTNRCISRQNHKSRKTKSRKTKSRRKATVKSRQKKKSRKAADNAAINCIHVPKKYEELAEKCACNEKWIRKGTIGSGAFGKVYKACRFRNCDYVVKVQKNDRFAKAEFNAYLKLQNTRILPKLLAAWTCKRKMYLVIERLYECTKPKARMIKQLTEKADKLLELGWLHCDLHWGNVMCTKNNRLVLIDFGLSVQKGKAPYDNQRGKTFKELKARQDRQLIDLEYDSLTSS